MSFLWITFAGVCWGLDGLIRSHIGGLSPLVIVTVEHFFGFCILALISWKTIRFPKLSKHAWLILFGVALFSGLLGTVSFTWAMAHIHYSSFGILFLLLKLQPVFTILTALVFLRERPRQSFYPLAIFALIASYFLSFGKSGLDFTFGQDVLRAVLAGLVAVVFWGSGTVFSRYLSQQGYSAKVMTSYRLGMVAIIGFVVIGIFAIFGIEGGTGIALSPGILGLILCIALLSGVIGTTAYYRGIKHTPATMASIFELSLPITGFLIDFLGKGKMPDGFQIVGGIVLIISMIGIARTRFSSKKLQ